MKILHTISSFRTGGAEKLLIDAAKQHYYTTNEKFNVCIINNEYDNHMLSELEKYANVYLLGKDESNKNIKYIYKFIKLVRQCKIDIIHCHNRGSYKFSIICRIILRRVRLIYTIHDTNIYNNI